MSTTSTAAQTVLARVGVTHLPALIACRPYAILPRARILSVFPFSRVQEKKVPYTVWKSHGLDYAKSIPLAWCSSALCSRQQSAR